MGYIKKTLILKPGTWNLKLNALSFRFYVSSFIFCVGLLFVAISVLPVEAAELKFSSLAQEFGVSQTFQIDFTLNTEGESINALEGQIIFPADLLELREIREGNTIISLWVEQPKIAETGKIVFSGIIPGGYNEKNGFLFSAIFIGKKEGRGALAVQESRVLKNDGLGTQASLKVFDFSFSLAVQPKTITPEPAEIIDNDLPEKFKPEIAQSQDLFDGKNFLVFATKDKGSGIARYEVREYRQKFLSFLSGWKVAVSPYLLTDQKLKSYIYVKAVDLAGNQRLEVVPPTYPLFWFENYIVYVIIILSLIVFLISWKILRRKKYTKIY